MVCLLGLVFDRQTLEQATTSVAGAVEQGRRCHLATPNVNILRLARSNGPLRAALLASDLSVADGMPLIWLSKLLRLGLPGRVAGSDLFEAVRARLGAERRVYFFGATDRICAEVRRRFASDGSGMRCSGTLAPGFGDVASMSDTGTLATINAARPDVLVVSISAAKGLAWIARNERSLTAPVIANLGATIHFSAGTVKRAPHFWRGIGLEWLWRITQEPRLWTRYAGDLGTLAAASIFNVAPALGLQVLAQVAKATRKKTLARRRTHVRLQLDPPDRNGDTARVMLLSGSFVDGDLDVLRGALRTANRTPGDIVIRLERRTVLDAASLGLILLAYGHQKRHGLKLAIEAPGWLSRAFIRSQGCGYLLAPASQRPRKAVPAPSGVPERARTNTAGGSLR